MRLAIVVLAMMLCVTARAEDDEGLLETPPLGGIPERMDVLDREWHEDVGTKDPVDDKATASDDDEKEDGLAVPDVEEEEAPVRQAEPSAPAKAGTAPRPWPIPPALQKPTDDVPAARGKRPVPDATAPED
jgi:hypothetical protein